MSRISNYTIMADLDQDETLLLHGYSGAWDIVTHDVARSLRQRHKSAPFKPLIGRAFDAEEDDGGVTPLDPRLEAYLGERGYLTEATPQDEYAVVADVAARVHAIASSQAPEFVFAVSYACNLACAYCFQDSLRSDPTNAPRLKAMTPAMVDRLFGVMDEISGRSAPEARRAPRRITLFGGEPLTPALRPVVEHVLARLRSEGPFSLSAVTNGTRLDAFSDLLGPDGISFLQVTVDGPPEVHDSRRIGPAGEPSFAAILRNVAMALGRGTQVKLRVNVDRDNLAGLPRLAEILNLQGWFTHPNFSAYATPVHESAGSGHQSCGFGSWKLREGLAELALAHPLVAAIAGPDAPWERRVRDLLRGDRDPLLSLQPSFCGAHTQAWVFDALGDVYACWERAGYPEERIGRVLPDGTLVLSDERFNAWRGRTIASNPTCARCPYAFYCGGGCALLAQAATGKLAANYCDDFSRRFKAVAVEQVTAARHRHARQTA